MDLRSRNQWGASVGLGPNMRLPAVGLHVHHSVTNGAVSFVDAMKTIENIGDDRFGRFSYSYCIHRSGIIGVGAGDTVGAHTSGYNSSTFGICFIGNYEVDQLMNPQVDAFRQLRSYLMGSGRLASNHYVYPHRHRKQTACPGDNVMRRWSQLLQLTSISDEEEDDMTLDELIQAMNEDTPLSNRFQKQADQGAGSAIARQSTTEGSALRTMVREIVREELDK